MSCVSGCWRPNLATFRLSTSSKQRHRLVVLLYRPVRRGEVLERDQGVGMVWAEGPFESLGGLLRHL